MGLPKAVKLKARRGSRTAYAGVAPKILLMDEPTSALDLYRQHEVLEVLRAYVAETGAMAVLALHDLNQVMRACTTTIAVAAGEIIAVGPTLQVLRPELIRRLYGIEARG